MEAVDLGGHPICAFYDKQKAVEDIAARNEAFKQQKKLDLMSHCKYTLQQAEEWVSSHVEFYLEIIEVS